MARQKKPSVRIEFDQDNADENDNRDTASDITEPNPKVRTKQQELAPKPDTGRGTEDPPKSPIINKHIRIGAKRVASPLAATAIARFERKERRPQLAEFYVYRDKDVNGRGFI